MEYSPRVLPWRNWDEWSETSRLLFAGDGRLRRLGVDRVQAWRARGRIPVAVDSTASLLEVALVESLPGSRSAQELRGLYSMVIIRAINGLVEGQQTKFYAEPVNVLAGRLGLPQWLVDLRHEATHSQLPSLSSLRMGAQQLLDWLYREYWQKQALDLQQAFLGAVAMLAKYRSVALRAQEESPNALWRACREEASAAAIRTPSDTLLAEALDSVVDGTSPTFLTAFLLPALVHCDTKEADAAHDAAASSSSSSSSWLPPTDERFLLTDEAIAEGGGAAGDADACRRAWARHRQLYLPLLVRLNRHFPGFAHALWRRLHDGGGGKAASCGLWAEYLRSRDWHSHFPYGRQQALFALRRAPGISFNLRDKPPENWTTPEADFMLSRASTAAVCEGLGIRDAADAGKEEEGEEGGVEGEQHRDGNEGDDWQLCTGWTARPLGCAIDESM